MHDQVVADGSNMAGWSFRHLHVATFSRNLSALPPPVVPVVVIATASVTGAVAPIVTFPRYGWRYRGRVLCLARDVISASSCGVTTTFGRSRQCGQTCMSHYAACDPALYTAGSNMLPTFLYPCYKEILVSTKCHSDLE